MFAALTAVYGVPITGVVPLAATEMQDGSEVLTPPDELPIRNGWFASAESWPLEPFSSKPLTLPLM